MKFVFYTNSVSPHQLPLAHELVNRLGAENYRYIYAKRQTAEREKLGWGSIIENDQSFAIKEDESNESREWLEHAEVLLSGIRDFDLFEYRASHGLKTVYCSERWFKPIHVFDAGCGRVKFDFALPGLVKLFHPRYFGMAKRIAALIKADVPFWYFPMGVWADRDMKLICRLFGVSEQRYSDKTKMWGYFVAPSESAQPHAAEKEVRKVLWVGRLLHLKRVDALIRAVCAHADRRRAKEPVKEIVLDVYGTGPEEQRLKKLSRDYGDVVRFHPPVTVSEVRRLMREHDVYVLSSNAYEGWGAVVSEALEEGMKVIGTYEAGSSATILPETNLFHAGDWKKLQKMLEGEIQKVDIGRWNAKNAARVLMEETNVE